MVPVSDAPRRWSDCAVPPPADANACLPVPTPAYRSQHLPAHTASTFLVVSPATVTGAECTPDWTLSNSWNFQKFSSWVSAPKKIQATSPRTIKAEKSERCLLPPRTRRFSNPTLRSRALRTTPAPAASHTAARHRYTAAAVATLGRPPRQRRRGQSAPALTPGPRCGAPR
jgi:hypothetical protein